MAKQLFIDFLDFVFERGLTSPTFFKILKTLLEKDGQTLDEIKENVNTSDVHVRHTIRKMIQSEIVERKITKTNYVLSEDNKKFIKKNYKVKTYHLKKEFKDIIEGR